MFKKSPIQTAVLLAVGALTGLPALPALAQDSTQRIEITGSAIRRVDAETAVPVTIIKAEDLKAQGVTTIEQALQSITSVQTTVGTSQTVGAGYGGASFANMRGLGQNKTLVLLNGRRIANNAIDGSAPDMNMIPIAALERVEVLRDGASSLYGTDAIGGVINFITRRDYQGATITLGYDGPKDPGATAKNLNIGAGYGDLSKQGFNIWGFFDYKKQNRLSGEDRPWNQRVSPGGLSPTPIPANYYQTGDTVGNPAAPSCASALYGLPAGDNTSCYISTSKFVDYIPQSEVKSLMLRGTLALGQDAQAGLEYFQSESNVQTRIAPVPYGTLYQNPTMPNGQPNPYYPGNAGNPGVNFPFVPDPTWVGPKVGSKYGANGTLIQPGYLVVKWRDLFNGPRGDENVNKQQRLLAFLDGSVAGWDYKAGLSENKNKVDVYLISGYNNGSAVQAGMLEGIINPYSLTQSADGLSFLNKALLAGHQQTAEATTTTLDLRGSRDLQDWFGAGRPAAIAVGGEFRKENLHQYAADVDYDTKVVASTGFDPATDNQGSRKVYALYTELAVPITKNLDVTAAVRWDKYSDFGDTYNPKVSFRFEPTKQVLLRGSYQTGFRAPSLYDLYSAQAYTNTPIVNDPVTCPGGVPTGAAINNCKAQFQTLAGGNPTLQPEKSKGWTLGLLFEPTRQLSFGVDLWWIRMRNQIGSIPATTLVDPTQYAIFQQYFHRDATGHLSTDGTLCPGADCGYIDQRTQNLGDLNTNGIDLSANYLLPTSVGTFNLGYAGTYVTKYEYQDYKNGPWNQNVGRFVGVGPVFRWQHNLTAVWNFNAFTVGAAAHFKSGYEDQYYPPDMVSHYATLDLYGTWRPIKQLSMTVGARNLTNRQPPYSDQDYTFQAGYDPRSADPTGRVVYVRATYNY